MYLAVWRSLQALSRLLVLDPASRHISTEFKQAGTGSGQGLMRSGFDPEAHLCLDISFQLIHNHYFLRAHGSWLRSAQLESNNSGLLTDGEC